ncbi:twin-arginine translocation signal domain-containing protein [Halostella sp. PRR32]|uniref:twin-arginine translocation signal domain-containing protein n=1 Tax=Halostella sp. PRR32 TaxID=3098147 RepID=UPI002B1E56BB|nr:twin-arginine translocation signal domain-containing protein [Halostella sp. PRR32]
MVHSRRTFLRASGVSALLGLAGCTGILEDDDSLTQAGGQPEYASWLYDPKDLLGIDTRGFASYDVESVMEQRDELPQDPFEGLEQANEQIEGVDLTEIAELTAVGGSTLNVERDDASAGASFVVEGSFDVDSIQTQIEEESDSDAEYQTGSYEGYELYYGDDGNQYSDMTVAFALDSEHVVVGMIEDADVTGRDAVEKMIDANKGNADRYYDQSEYAELLIDKLGEATVVMGGQFDLGSPVRDQISDPRARTLVEGLYGAGMSGTLDGETTDNEIILAYDEETEVPVDTAQDLVDEARNQSPRAFENIEDVSVTGGERTLTISMTLDAAAFWENYSGMTGATSMSGSASSSRQSETPMVSWEADWEETSNGGLVTITHHGGDHVDADNLSIEGDIRSTSEWQGSSDGRITAGSSIEVEVESGGYVELVWEGDSGSEMVLASFVNPN